MPGWTRRSHGLAAAGLLCAGCAFMPVHDAALDVRPAETGGDAMASGEMYYQRAVAAIDARDYGLALDYLQAAQAREPGSARLHNAFGVVYDKLGRFDLSARYYARAAASDPGSTIVARNIAYSQMLQGKRPATQLAFDPPRTNVAPASAPSDLAMADLPAVPEPAGLELIRPIAYAPALPLDASTIVPTNLAMADLPSAPVSTGFEPINPIAYAPKLSIDTSAITPPNLAMADLPSAPVSTGVESIRPIAYAPQLPIDISEIALPRLPALQASATVRRHGLTGAPVRIIDASGRPGAADAVHRGFAALHWTIAAGHGKAAVQAATTVRYPAADVAVARAMARTLPYPVRLTVRNCDCIGIELVLGTDYLRWSAHPERRAGSVKLAALPREGVR